MPDWDPLASTIRQLLVDEDWRLVECRGPASEDEIKAAEAALGVRFPKSYRAFLRNFGTGSSNAHNIFGLPGDRLWGDVVAMNRIATRSGAPHLVKFLGNMGERSFFLDTSVIGDDGECPPVVLQSGGDRHIVADSFLRFLQKVREGLL